MGAVTRREEVDRFLHEIAARVAACLELDPTLDEKDAIAAARRLIASLRSRRDRV